MDAANQQKILGYFIEEAKEHLETLEQGILELSTVANDMERMNELFRAAHSVKGGAAMLGYTSIQRASHRLEDAFKIFKENEIPVNEYLESLLLKGYDVLQILLEKLQSPSGLQDDEAKQIMTEAEPQFTKLQDYLNQLVQQGSGAPQGTTATSGSGALLEEKLRQQLKQMLGVFKQQDSPASRQQLQNICDELTKFNAEAPNWQTVVQSTRQAIANPLHSFPLLAPVVIKELKQAGDQLNLGQSDQIQPSEVLKNLANAGTPQILVPIEPEPAAQILLKAFNHEELSQLVQLLASQI